MKTRQHGLCLILTVGRQNTALTLCDNDKRFGQYQKKDDTADEIDKAGFAAAEIKIHLRRFWDIETAVTGIFAAAAAAFFVEIVVHI